MNGQSPAFAWRRPVQAEERRQRISTSKGRGGTILQRIPKLLTAAPGPSRVKNTPKFSKRLAKRVFRKVPIKRLQSFGLSEPIPDSAKVALTTEQRKDKNRARMKRKRQAKKAASARHAEWSKQPKRPRTERRAKHKIVVREKRAELRAAQAELERAQGKAA